MSRSEKRYFKVFASQQSGEDKNYLLLFDAIEQQKSPDDDALRKQFADKTFSKQLHVVKNYLYKLILRSMRLYAEQKSVDTQIYNLLCDADYLTEKGLFDLAWKLLEKAEELAQPRERYIAILEILRRKREIIREVEKERNPHITRLQMLDEEKKTIDILYNISSYRRLSTRLFALMHTKGFSRDGEEWKEIEDIFHSDYIQDESKPASIISSVQRYGIRAAYFSAVGKNLESYEETKHSIEIIEDCLRRYNYAPADYIAALSNHLVEAFNLEKYDDLMVGLEKLRSAPARTGSDTTRNDIHIFRIGSNLELMYYMRTAQFAKATELAARIEQQLEQYQGKVDVMYEILFHYNLAVVYYYTGRHNDSLRHLNHLVNEHTEALRKDIFSFARIIMLFLHYELNNMDYVEHLLLNISRYLQKRNRLYKYESVVLTMFKKLRVAKNKNEEEHILLASQKDLEVLRQDAHEANAFKSFDALSWIEARLQNIPLRQVLENRHHKKGDS